MAQKSWFFNSAIGDPRVYQASDFAHYFGKVLSTGLLHDNNVPGLAVSAGGTNLTTSVAPGSAIMEGYAYENTGVEQLSHSVPEITLDRIDRVVLRLDKKNANRYIKLFVIEGEPSLEPVAPSLQRNTLVWELSLAQVRIRANTAAISSTDVLDERLNREVAGLVYSLISKPSPADIQTGGYEVVAETSGQTDFIIPLPSFDKVGDGLTVFVNGEKAALSSYDVIYPRIVRFKIGLPAGTRVEFNVIRGVVKLEGDYIVRAGNVGIADLGGYYESDNVEGALSKIGEELFAPKAKVYGVRIDLRNQDPEKGVERIDDAAKFTSYTDFDDKFPFNQIRPCVIREGVVIYYLDKKNFNLKEDGTPSNINDFATGDVMIEFPIIYWKFDRDTNYQYVRYSSQNVDGKYQALAHKQGNILKNKLYISAYPGSSDTHNRLRSVSGKPADKNRTLGVFRDYARNNGAGYELINYYQILMMQVLFLVQFANRNSSAIFSSGVFKDISGSLDSLGMSVLKNQSSINKYLGIEQILTNVLMKVEGSFIDGGRLRLTNNPVNYNDTGSGFEDMNLPIALGTSGHTVDVLGDNIGGFLPINLGGSSSTWYASSVSLTNTTFLHFGDFINNGFFSFRSEGAFTGNNVPTYARIIYMK